MIQTNIVGIAEERPSPSYGAMFGVSVCYPKAYQLGLGSELVLVYATLRYQLGLGLGLVLVYATLKP